MSSKPQYNVGDTIGAVRVTGIQRENYFRYQLECLKCGRTFTAPTSEIVKQKYSKYGCPECRKQAKEDEKVQELTDLYVGKKYSQLIIQGVHMEEYTRKKGARKDGGTPLKHRVAYATCLCDCGNVSDIPLYRVTGGYIKQCAKCARENLDRGYEISRNARFEGTSVLCISNRATNSNNTTGVKGVSRMANGRYRAYINLARKQINLGTFWTLEEAKAAHETAEKSVYKPIIDRWEKAQEENNGNKKNTPW